MNSVTSAPDNITQRRQLIYEHEGCPYIPDTPREKEESSIGTQRAKDKETGGVSDMDNGAMARCGAVVAAVPPAPRCTHAGPHAGAPVLEGGDCVLHHRPPLATPGHPRATGSLLRFMEPKQAEQNKLGRVTCSAGLPSLDARLDMHKEAPEPCPLSQLQHPPVHHAIPPSYLPQ